jgi:uncharacterized protein DUF3300
MRPFLREFLAATTAAILASSHAPLFAQGATPPPSPAPAASPAPEEPVKLSNDQLDSLVAPIALYPDPLLAQTLVASTYPLEIIQLQQWLAKNSKLKDKELADAVAKQDWDPSIQSMAATPEVVKRLADDIQWTTDLGNAFLAQQSEVMDACQRMRKKAKDKGALESNEQQKVETKTEGEKTVIVVQPANPEVIYVPSYSPTVVYGPPPYPYPPIYYPPYPPGAAFVSFSFGVMMGAAFWGGSCCGCGWGGNNVNINVNNNFNRNTNINRGGGGGRGGVGGAGGVGGVGGVGGAGGVGGVGGAGGGNWQHNPKHRGGAPYGDKSTANKFGGNARGDSLSQRQSKAGGGPSASNRAAGGAGGRGGSPSAGNRASSPSASNRAGGGGGGDRVGNRSVGSSSGRQSGFGGGSGGFSGSSARSAGSRGSSSFGGSRGGGSRGGGGGRRR